MPNISIGLRVEDDIAKLVSDLKEERQLGMLLRLFLSALKQDKAGTILSVMGLERNFGVLNTVNKSILFNEYIKNDLMGKISFKEYCSELSSVDLISLGLDLGTGVSIGEVKELIKSEGSNLKSALSSKKAENQIGLVDSNVLEQMVLNILNKQGVLGKLNQETASLVANMSPSSNGVDNNILDDDEDDAPTENFERTFVVGEPEELFSTEEVSKVNGELRINEPEPEIVEEQDDEETKTDSDILRDLANLGL